MKAKKVYESIRDVLKPKSKDDFREMSRDWVKLDEEFPVHIERETKDRHEVVLVSKGFYHKTADEFMKMFDTPYYKKWGDKKLNDIRKSYEKVAHTPYIQGFIFTENKDGSWEYKLPTWSLSGEMQGKYDWKTPGMVIDPITDEEMDKLPTNA